MGGPRARRGARELGDRGLIASALGALALASAFDGAIEEAQAIRAEAAALVDSLSDDELVRHLDLAINALAGAEILLDHPDAASAHIERGLAVAEATGQGQVLPILFWTGTIRTMRGPAARGRRGVRDRDRGRARRRATTRASRGTCSAARWSRAPRATSPTALATARESIETCCAGWSAASRAPAPGTRWRPRCSPTATPAGAVEALVEAGGGDDLRADPRRLAGVGARAADPACRLALGHREAAAQRGAEAQAWAGDARA